MPAATKVRSVVVDDQLTMRTLIRTGLQQIGMTDIREFASADEALASLKAQPAHLILSDFNMPGMDGLTFRADPDLKSTAFFLLTGRADKELVQRAAQYGVNNYVVKPFTVDGLRKKLEQVFGHLT